MCDVSCVALVDEDTVYKITMSFSRQKITSSLRIFVKDRSAISQEIFNMVGPRITTSRFLTL